MNNYFKPLPPVFEDDETEQRILDRRQEDEEGRKQYEAQWLRERERND